MSKINCKGAERKLGNALFAYIPVYISKLSIGHEIQGHMLHRSINDELEILRKQDLICTWNI